MNVLEREEFLDAMKEAVKIIKLTQAALQRARSQCHQEVYEEVNVMARRVYELKVKAEWLRYAVLSGMEPSAALSADPEGRPGADPASRLGADRRIAIDRRIQAMQRQLLPLPSLEAELQAS